MRKYLPDPFVFAIALTLLTVLLAMGIEGQGIGDVTRAWGRASGACWPSPPRWP